MNTVFTLFTPEFPVLVALFLLGIAAFAFSTLAGGGGGLLMIPVVNSLVGVSATAPVVNLGTFLGRPSRLYLFWQQINWTVVRYYAPSAIMGAWLAGLVFSQVKAQWLQVAVGIFLISTVFQYRFGKKQRSFAMPLSGFIPLGFIVSIASTTIGALGPVLNPFYMNAKLQKEQLIATKTANAFLLGIAQIGSYTFFGLLSGKLWVYGFAIGAGAAIGNILGKRWLGNISTDTFQKLLISFMVFSGILLIIKNMI